MAQSGNVTISGKVVESDTDNPVEFATVAVVNSANDTPITGATTSPSGSFSLTTNASNFYIEVTFIGYDKRTIKNFEITNGKINLGTITLSTDTQQLEEIVVEGEKSSTEFKLDKRVFNVGADLSNAGGSALDVLNHVPSVNVNIEGVVSLRGSSGVQILINGKPSVLTGDDGSGLGSITADMIESVEVITNPSAKYDAEGTSGIINIIIKKEDKKGTNGSVSLNAGVPRNNSVGFSLNHRTERFNLFTQMGVGTNKLPDKTSIVNSNLLTDTTIYSTGKEYRNERYYNILLGSDYYINDLNIITLSGSFALELEKQPSKTYYNMVSGANQMPLSAWERTETTEAVNPKYQFDLQYKRDFEDHEDHDLILSAVGRFFGKDQSSDFDNMTTSGASIYDLTQKTFTNYKLGTYTYKLDYTRPIGDEFTIETGGQYLINDVGNDYAVENLIGNEFITDSSQTNTFEFYQGVLGLYGTTAYEKEKWGLKLGLRLENTEINTYLVNTDESNDRNYTNFFPSAHTSYKLRNNISLQAGYSRRIYRPGLRDLNPFNNIRNNFSIRRGNPDLLPEFTDSYELGSIYDFEKMSLNASVYHRYTTDVIGNISVFENNVNISRPENIGINRTTGVEVNAKYDPVKWLTMNADFNYNYFARDGQLEGVNFDFTTEQWTSKVNTKFKLPADIDIELTGQYQSSYLTVQGEMSDILFMDMGARKKIFKGKGLVNLSVRDVFASRIQINRVLQENFYLYNRDTRGRFIVVGFSYGFGKGEAMAYGGKGHH
ncbi:MAG: TonB-dependent receptor domain-containing protein [Bacteroidota bacterium]